MTMTRGDVHELKPGRRARGHEQRGKRFGVVLQATIYAGLSTVVVAPTSRGAVTSFLQPEIQLLKQTTRVLVSQIKAVDQSRLGKRVGRLDAHDAAAIDDVLRELLGLD
jgi:mRNA interferase MazF